MRPKRKFVHLHRVQLVHLSQTVFTRVLYRQGQRLETEGVTYIFTHPVWYQPVERLASFVFSSSPQ